MASRARTGIARHDCGQLVIWARVHGTLTPLNRTPDPQGIIAASCDVLGAWHARPETPGVALDVTEKRYAVHECGAETAAEPPAQPTQIDTWRKAQSAHSAAARNRRGKRGPRPVTGIRWRPR